MVEEVHSSSTSQQHKAMDEEQIVHQLLNQSICNEQAGGQLNFEKSINPTQEMCCRWTQGLKADIPQLDYEDFSKSIIGVETSKQR